VGYTWGMAKIVGTPPASPRRGLLGTLAAGISPAARMRAEMTEGAGLHRLLELVGQLPDSVTAVVRPGLGFFMKIDCCLIGPGKVLAIDTVHWTGKVTAGQHEEWTGALGTDLGRPDRRAFVFADRLAFGGQVGDRVVEPVVICTGGAVDLQGLKPLAPVIPWNEAPSFLGAAFSPGPAGDVAALVKLLTSP